jgi:lipopolysaccharide/colanic/teichoic acid biosynthesis glycosyltransferase
MKTVNSPLGLKVRTPIMPGYFRVKSWLDRLVALGLLVPGLPMMGILIVLIRLSSKGPGVYSQERVGKDGKVFTMFKLRSMRSDAEASTGPVWSAAGSDSRVTRLGYWLRKLHLDELPQLFNVLRGEMSLIGPRPERPEFVMVLADSISGYRDRLRVAPGITGLAQINLPPDTDLNSVRRKLVLDLEYIQTANFLLDLRMFLCTLFRLIGIKGDTAMRVMWLTRAVHLPDDQVGTTLSSSAAVTPEVIATKIAGEEAVPRPASSQRQPARRRARDSEEFEFEVASQGK